MLQREMDMEAGWVMISQPAHAWVSGQLARRWGNAEFGEPAPREEVCLAAALHDVGFLEWEKSPRLNPKTGLPHTFLDLPVEAHLGLWSKGIQEMLAYGRYPALLVSRHFTGLCERHSSVSPPDRRLEKKFLEEQASLQQTLATSLENDFYYEPFSTGEILAHNRQLVSVWDWLSLLLCMGFREERVMTEVPSAQGMQRLTLRPLEAGATRVEVSPWPFRDGNFHVTCEGRHLLQRYQEEQEMREALRAASPVTLRIELVRGG